MYIYIIGKIIITLSVNYNVTIKLGNYVNILLAFVSELASNCKWVCSYGIIT